MTQYQQSTFNKYMYNEFEDTDFQEQQGGDKEQLIENKEPSNIKIGGYPIQYLIHGGSNEFTRNDRFKNLVVPVGLVMEDPGLYTGLYTGGSKEHEYNAESIDRPINDELFNHLFGLTATIKSKEKTSSKESSKENIKRKTQKHRKGKY